MVRRSGSSDGQFGVPLRRSDRRAARQTTPRTMPRRQDVAQERLVAAIEPRVQAGPRAADRQHSRHEGDAREAFERR